MRAYGAAWKRRNAQAAVDLFAEDVVYSLPPFTAPICGRRELLKYWKHVAGSQEQIHFTFAILAVSQGEGVARWRAGFVRLKDRKRLELDGICVVSLNSEGLCTRFHEWWHKRETVLPSGKDAPHDPA